MERSSRHEKREHREERSDKSREKRSSSPRASSPKPKTTEILSEEEFREKTFRGGTPRGDVPIADEVTEELKTFKSPTVKNRSDIHTIAPLTDKAYESLDIPIHQSLVRVASIDSPSSLLHAIVRAFYTPYINGKDNSGVLFDRTSFVNNLRKEIAEFLLTTEGQKKHEELGYKNLSKSIPSYDIKNMVAVLSNPNLPLNNTFVGLIASLLDKNIFVIDSITKDVKQSDIPIRNVPCIILLLIHTENTLLFEPVGLSSDSLLYTLFDPDHSLITAIKERLNSRR